MCYSWQHFLEISQARGSLLTKHLHNLYCRIQDVEKGYYADGENAYDMRKYFGKSGKKGKDDQPAQVSEPAAATS